MLVVAARRALGRRPGSKASAGSLRMAEQLSADPAVVEAGVGAPVRLALGVEGEPGPREAGGALELVPNMEGWTGDYRPVRLAATGYRTS